MLTDEKPSIEKIDTEEDKPNISSMPDLTLLSKISRSIKYLGSSDIRRLEPGENLLGTQMVPLFVTIEWNVKNSHIIYTGNYPSVTEDFWDQLLTYDTFEDVTNKKNEQMPLSDFEKIFAPR
jgi:hypothetical protein